ncbi:hypothetical protein OC25_05950 [Pedobacter kyungheensis]|uniref:Shikimate kinase n=1 Tax=Pedobacter kyungheensis TaxID=1069985 RepID=A0A0C1DCL9_9SPHI|nr:hypothetical protein [Pedobacter kyungheensis]KIA95386.1 hypothetical protein OC25_05950 [Pedobacter kyungheensis]
MKTIVFGPSGSGKTYLAGYLAKQGLPAYDADQIEGLCSWYSQSGIRVSPPASAEQALNNGYSFLWSRKVLIKFLDNRPEVFVFGGSGNVFNMIDLFDRAYFLKVDKNVQLERLNSIHRPAPMMDFDRKGAVIWGDRLEQEALKQNIPFIDANQSPEEIYKQFRTTI